MNAVQYNQQENYYKTIDGVKVYVDYSNERLKIVEHKGISENTVTEIVDFSNGEGLGKIISNCRLEQVELFQSCGFIVEGRINGFYGGEDGYCVSHFLNSRRQTNSRTDEEDSILSQCLNDSKRLLVQEGNDLKIRNANIYDIPQMIKLFSRVFETYPSPIFSREYLKKIMGGRVLFKVIEEDGKIISIASADMDKTNLNAEITDCATYPEHRGRGLLPNLIYSLEADLKKMNFRTAYSLSRAINPGINKVLSRMDYEYCGRLVNNCHICGGYEDMNIWVKAL